MVDGKKSSRQGGVRKASTRGLDGISNREFVRKKFLKGERRGGEHIPVSSSA